uniref:Pentatricopeptide repeat domain 2 n=1 Tax=Cyprinus carpio carpio TaxID=630221 RepID=A0A9J8BBU4_CYPCA
RERDIMEVAVFDQLSSKLFLLAKRYLLSEDVVKLQGFQQRKLAVTHQVSKSKGTMKRIVTWHLVNSS